MISARIDEPRRRYKRFEPPRADVTCRPQQSWFDRLLKKNVALRLKDISLGGVQIIATRELRLGEKTELSLSFPGFPDTIVAEADVRWCRRDTLSLAPQWRAGLTFKRIAPTHEAALLEVDRTYLGGGPPA